MFAAKDLRSGQLVYASKKGHENKSKDYVCPCCGERVFRRAGEIRKAHFSHYAERDDCVICQYERTPNYKSDWHREWQERYPEENREITVKNNGKIHIADVLINDTVIEFQHSHLSEKDFLARTDFYINEGYSLVWLFDADCQQNLAPQITGIGIEKYFHEWDWDKPFDSFYVLEEARKKYGDKLTVFIQRYDKIYELYEGNSNYSLFKTIPPVSQKDFVIATLGISEYVESRNAKCKEMLALREKLEKEREKRRKREEKERLKKEQELREKIEAERQKIEKDRQKAEAERRKREAEEKRKRIEAERLRAEEIRRIYENRFHNLKTAIADSLREKGFCVQDEVFTKFYSLNKIWLEQIFAEFTGVQSTYYKSWDEMYPIKCQCPFCNMWKETLHYKEFLDNNDNCISIDRTEKRTPCFVLAKKYQKQLEQSLGLC